MAISSTPTQTAGAHGASGTSIAVTISAPAAGANLYVLVSSALTTPAVTSITGGGVTWAGSAAITRATNRYVAIWEGVNSSGSGTSITVNFNGTIANSDVWVLEFSGVAIASSTDTTGTNQGNSANPSATLSPNPTSSLNELMLFIERRGGNYSSGPTGSFTQVTQGSVNSAALAAYRVVASTSGSYSTDFTISASGTWDAVMLAVKAATGSDATVTAVAGTSTSAGISPALSAGSGVQGVAGAATATAVAPLISAGSTTAGVAGTATASATAPSLAASSVVAGTLGAATATGVSPVLSADSTVSGVAASATGDAQAPTVSASYEALAATGVASADAAAPTVFASSVIVGTAGSSTADFIAPTVTGAGAGTVLATAATASAVAVSPVISGSSQVAGQVGQASASVNAPGLTWTANVLGVSGTALAAFRVPSVSGALAFQIGLASSTLAVRGAASVITKRGAVSRLTSAGASTTIN